MGDTGGEGWIRPGPAVPGLLGKTSLAHRLTGVSHHGSLDTLLQEQGTGTYPVKRGSCLGGLAGPFSDGHTWGRRAGEGGLQAFSVVTTPLWLLSRA